MYQLVHLHLHCGRGCLSSIRSFISLLLFWFSSHVFTFALTCLAIIVHGFPSLLIYIYIYTHTWLSLSIPNNAPSHVPKVSNGCRDWSPKSSPVYYPRSFFWWMTIEKKNLISIIFLLTHMLQSPESFGCGHELQIKVTKLLLEELKEWMVEWGS
jgi:hypothetical protein